MDNFALSVKEALSMSDPGSNSFWADYAAALQKLCIPESKSKLYIVWVKRFERFL
jgi:hypothetical protein